MDEQERDEIGRGTLTRWAVAALSGVISALLIVIWALLAGIWNTQADQIRGLREDLKQQQTKNEAQVSILQNQVYDMKVAMKELDSRIQRLVDTFNERSKVRP